MGTWRAARPIWTILALMASAFIICGTVISGTPAASTKKSNPSPLLRSSNTSPALTAVGS